MPARSSKIPPRLILSVGGVLLFILVLHLAGVAALRYFVEHELHPALPKGTYIGDVHLNLFTGTLKIDDFELRNEGRVRMRFGELVVRVSPWRLATGAVHIKQAALSRVFMRVDRREDGSFDLGLPDFGTDAGPPPEGREPLDLTIDGIELDRILVEYHDGALISAVLAKTLKVGAYSMRAVQQQIPIDWDLQWEGRSITGDAVVTVDRDQVAATGRLATELLNIGRAQRFARLEPVARGELSYEGPFSWQAPRLTLGGAVLAPRLSYREGGQQVEVRGLALPAYGLDLVTSPVLAAELALDQSAQLASMNWQSEGQGADVSGLRLGGKLHYADKGAVTASGLKLVAQRLAWHQAQRSAELAGVKLNGALRQSLAAQAGLPTLNMQLEAASVAYKDDAETLSAQLNALKVGDLALNATEGQPGRGLTAKIDIGAGRAAQGASAVDWSGLGADLTGSIGDATSVAGDLNVSGVTLVAPALPNGPLTLKQVTAAGLDVGEQTRFERLHLGGIALPAELKATALRVAAVDLRNGRYSTAGGVALGEIVIDGLQTGVIRDKKGQWRHVMSSAKPAAKPGKTAKSGGQGGDVPWKIGGVRVTGNSHITVADNLNPGMKPIRHGLEKVEVGALASTAPNKDTPFSVALRPDKYSEFRIDGVVRPLAKNLYLKAKGHLHGFGLTSVNGLIANDLGHRFLEGQLDDDFTITIDKNRLDMGNALAMAGLAVEEIEGKEGPPLGTAVALLEDRDGNIKLDVPVAGDLSDPDFRVLGALNPIIMKAVAGTAALAIQPLGSVLLVGSLLADQALKVTFQPALFDAGSTELNPAAKKYLGQLAGKLKDKPKLAVRVCGVVVDAERQKDKKGNYLDKKEELLVVAQRRADEARAYLAGHGAGSKQLRRCRPSLDTGPNAKPRVDIKF